MRPVWSIVVIFAAIQLHCPYPAQAQIQPAIYMNIQESPSKLRWCLPEAGDDPDRIISGRCIVYSECLNDLGLKERVDRRPYPALSKIQVEGLRKCHQALDNAARTNPQIQGSKATQDWLEHDVIPGSEAKSSPVPAKSPTPP
jgi:hypothetical protein